MCCLILASIQRPGSFQLLVCIVIAYVIWASLRRSMSHDPLAMAHAAFVVKRLTVRSAGPEYVTIIGRRGGLVSWLLTICGVDPTITLSVKEDRIECSRGSLSGRVVHMLPMASICNLGAGYSKPFFLLVLAVFLLFCAILCVVCFLLNARYIGPECWIGPLIVGLVGGACLACYYLMKTLTLFFLPPSACGICLGFKRSLIEGVNIDESTAQKIILIVSDLIERKTMRGADGLDGIANSGSRLAEVVGTLRTSAERQHVVLTRILDELMSHGVHFAGAPKGTAQKSCAPTRAKTDVGNKFFHCSKCGRMLCVPVTTQVGQNVRCPDCGTKTPYHE